MPAPSTQSIHVIRSFDAKDNTYVSNSMLISEKKIPKIKKYP